MSLSPVEREGLYKSILFALIRSDRGYTKDLPAMARELLAAAENELKALTSHEKKV